MKNGFTIIELMLAILVLSVVIAMGAPSFTSTIQDNRLASQTNILLSSLNYARSEAVKIGANVVVCGSTNLSNCNTSNWESGFIVFRDTNLNGDRDVSEDLLRVEEALSGGNTLRTSGFSSSTSISFDERGMVASSGTLALCDDRGASNARGVVLNISGQARSALDEDADGIINLHGAGGNVTCP